MARITGSYPEDIELLIEGAVEVGVFGGKSDALLKFARTHFEEHENERVAAAVALYEREAIALGDASRLADVDRWTIRDVLREETVLAESQSLIHVRDTVFDGKGVTDEESGPI